MENILQTENNRNDGNIRKIYFYKNGESPWYRAYELSAYYAFNYNNGLSEDKRLKAQRKTSKYSDDGIIQVGLQITSFKKYFPDIQLSMTDEKCISFDITSDNEFNDITVESYKEKYHEWKNKYNITKGGSKQKNHTGTDTGTNTKTIYSSPSSFSGIMKEIIRYDTHNRTEDDLREFIYTLKEMCSNLI